MKIKQIFNGIDVDIDLKDGVNLLSGDSGTGKTLVMQAIELFCASNNISCTFLNYRHRNLSEDQIITSCASSRIILIDNADLFITQNILNEVRDSSDCIVLSLKDSSKIDGRNITEYLVDYGNLQLRLKENKNFIVK